ncbi:MAG: hypothetical protein ACI4NM_06335 [Bullifex sp.]
MVKAFVLHVYKNEEEVYSLSFSSRAKIAKYLRNQGLKFRDSSLAGGISSLTLTDKDNGLIYEVEESFDDFGSIIHDGAVYIPLKDFCERVNKKRDTVYKSYKRGRIRGLTVGKYNLVYIYWETRK